MILNVLAGLSLVGVAASAASAVTIYGVSAKDQLLRFDSATPGQINSSLAINGLQANETVLGIDFRPANNQLYAVGSFGRIYTIDLNSAAASFVSTIAIPNATLNGSDFGIDFNPTVDRLRVVSNTGQNLRINVDTGVAILDGMINYGPGSTVVPNLMGAAYTNSVANATTTTLYTIDAGLDQLNKQIPPNDGTQVAVGTGLGVDTTAVGGIDIAPITNIAYAALTPAGSSVTNLYTIDLSDGTGGAATLVGRVNGGLFLTDIAVVPEPTSLGLLGVGALALLRRRRQA